MSAKDRVQQERDASGSPVPDEGPPPEPVDKEALKRQQRLARILAGYIDDVPPLSSRIVRIFTSSTFTGNLPF